MPNHISRKDLTVIERETQHFVLEQVLGDSGEETFLQNQVLVGGWPSASAGVERKEELANG